MLTRKNFIELAERCASMAKILDLDDPLDACNLAYYKRGMKEACRVNPRFDERRFDAYVEKTIANSH